MSTQVISRCGCSGGSGGCGGSCGGQCSCESRCCDLECLERPNFYCGQLLTDADLSAMVEWTRKRFALSRYRDGWGVVCGLDLTCSGVAEDSSCCGSSKTSKGPWVYLSAGYAVDCCGNDLVVCDPLKVDLSSVCRSPDDPCLPKPTGTAPEPDDGEEEEQPEGEEDCFTADRKNLFAVQVYLRYGEQLAQGQRAMFRGGGECGGSEACEYARVLERPCIALEVVPLKLDDEEEEPEKERWVMEFMDRYRRTLRSLRDFAEIANPDTYLKYIRDNPPFQLCYLKELICCLRDSDKFDPKSAIRVSMLLLYDWILREIQCGCFSCSPDKGVPLGLVILRRTSEGRVTTCGVYMIDPGRRYRRWIRQALCQSAEFRDFDLSDLYGRSMGSVQSKLQAAGVRHEIRDWTDASPAEFTDFAASMETPKFRADLASTRALRAHVVRDPFGVSRVIGFD